MITLDAENLPDENYDKYYKNITNKLQKELTFSY